MPHPSRRTLLPNKKERRNKRNEIFSKRHKQSFPFLQTRDETCKLKTEIRPFTESAVGRPARTPQVSLVASLAAEFSEPLSRPGQATETWAELALIYQLVLSRLCSAGRESNQTSFVRSKAYSKNVCSVWSVSSHHITKPRSGWVRGGVWPSPRIRRVPTRWAETASPKHQKAFPKCFSQGTHEETKSSLPNGTARGRSKTPSSPRAELLGFMAIGGCTKGQ